MFRRWLPALAAVAAALLLAPAPARAQMFGFPRGLGRFPSLPFFSPNYPFYQGTAPQYTIPMPSDFRRAQPSNPGGLTGRPQQKIEDFDPPPAKSAPSAAAAPKAATAQIEVSVPAGAEVWFEGQKNTETGAVRHFETPVLQPRAFSSYEVRVRRKGAASDTDEIRHVILRAGEKRTVEMMTRPEVATRQDKR